LRACQAKFKEAVPQSCNSSRGEERNNPTAFAVHADLDVMRLENSGKFGTGTGFQPLIPPGNPKPPTFLQYRFLCL